MDFLAEQLFTFLIMLIFGFVLAFCFDMYRALSSSFNRNKSILINMTDIFFGILSGCIGFFILILSNWGDLRFFVFLAIFLGSSIYFYLRRLIKVER